MPELPYLQLAELFELPAGLPFVLGIAIHYRTAFVIHKHNAVPRLLKYGTVPFLRCGQLLLGLLAVGYVACVYADAVASRDIVDCLHIPVITDFHLSNYISFFSKRLRYTSQEVIVSRLLGTHQVFRSRI